jgi:hypothetical protein
VKEPYTATDYGFTNDSGYQLLQEQMLEPVLERLMALALGRESYDPALGKSQVMAITVLITEVLTIEESLLEQYDRFIEEYGEK